MLRSKDHGKMLWLAAIGLAFFAGLAVANGHVTENAVHSAVADVQAGCDWSKKRALERQRCTLQSP